MPVSGDVTPFKLGTFSAAGSAPFAGLVVGERAMALRAAAVLMRNERLDSSATASVLALLEDWPNHFPILQRMAHAMAEQRTPEWANASVPIAALTFHPPVNLPRQIFCSGANYKKHVVDIIVAQPLAETQHLSVEERRAYGVKKMEDRAASGTPFFFIKAQSAATGPYDPIVLPFDAKQPDWELELAVVIGRRAHRVSRRDALSYVAGYTIVNDLTTREKVSRKEGDMRELGMDWIACKCSPTFLPMGPYLVPAAFVNDPQQLQVTLKLNGETMQNESTEDMIFGVARLIEALSATCVLQPGDLICTGSPSGNGVHYGRFLQPGDVMEGTITGLGAQRNSCIAE